jgi:outer membrane protein TolC
MARPRDAIAVPRRDAFVLNNSHSTFPGGHMALKHCCGVMFFACLICAGPGCARYKPKPLDPAQALQQIQRVTLDDVLARNTAPGQSIDPKTFNPADGLDENEAAVAALFLNPQLQAKRQEHGIAAAQLITAGLWPNPEFDSKAQWDTKGPGRAIEANLAIEVLRWRERKGEQEAAKANQKAVVAEVMAEEWRVVTEARVAHWNIIGLEAKLKASQAAADIAGELVKKIKARLDRGAGSQFDLNLAELDRLRFQSDALRAETDVETARRGLLVVLGLPPATPLKLQPDHDSAAPLIQPWDLERLTEMLPESPRMKTLQWRYEASEGELRAAIARQFPSLKLGPAADFAYNGNAWETLAGSLVSFQIPFLNRNGAQIKEKIAARDLARARHTAELHAVRAELADAIGAMRALEKRVLFTRDEALPKVDESIALSEKMFAAGEISIVALLKAQSAGIEARISHHDVLLSHRRARGRIESVLGRRIETLPAAATAKTPAAQDEKSVEKTNPTQEK